MNCEDNMNAMLEGVTVTGRDGKVTNLEQAGSVRGLFDALGGLPKRLSD